VAKRTLVQLVGDALGEMGLPVLASVVGSGNATAVQMLALANRDAKETIRLGGQAGGWQELRKQYTFNVQSTGMIPGCSYTAGSNTITIGTPATQAPQVGWAICTSGGSNATGFVYPTYVTAVAGSTITVSNPATVSNSNVTMAFGQESYSLPSDYDYMIEETAWDRGYRWQLYGPLTPQEWQVLKSGLSPTGPRRRWRLMGGLFYLDPIPYDSNLLVFEYYSVNFATAADTTAKALFTADSDTYVLPDDLLVMGLIWRWRRAKGLDYTQEYDSWKRRLDEEIARDTGAQTLRLDVGQAGVKFLSTANVPDTGFGT
jgi:hypothetical protein